MPSFWQDLEEMQREIEKLDGQSKHNNNRSSTRSSSNKMSPTTSTLSSTISSGNTTSNNNNNNQSSQRMKELQEKTRELSQRIAHAERGHKRNGTNNSDGAHLQQQLHRVVNDVEQTYDANSHLINHLGALETEIEKLSAKEDMWKATANMVDHEVHSLHSQINALHQNNSGNNNNNNNNSQPTVRRNVTAKGNSIITEFRKEEVDNGAARKAMALKQQLLLSKRDNQRLLQENKNLGRVLRNSQKTANDNINRLNAKLVDAENNYRSIQRKLHASESKVDHMKARNADLMQENGMLKQIADNFEALKESDNKLQLEYQKSLQDCLEARREKALFEQRLNNAEAHIQEIELKCRQINVEKMNGISELRTMKQLFSQEQKRNLEKFERTTNKLEAELSYSKKMYQEIKKRYRNLQHKFEAEQPKMKQLQKELDQERDAFHSKIHDNVTEHVARLGLISKKCAEACENIQYVQADQNKYESTTNNMMTTETKVVMNGRQGRKMTSIWEPSN